MTIVVRERERERERKEEVRGCRARYLGWKGHQVDGCGSAPWVSWLFWLRPEQPHWRKGSIWRGKWASLEPQQCINISATFWPVASQLWLQLNHIWPDIPACKPHRRRPVSAWISFTGPFVYSPAVQPAVMPHCISEKLKKSAHCPRRSGSGHQLPPTPTCRGTKVTCMTSQTAAECRWRRPQPWRRVTGGWSVLPAVKNSFTRCHRMFSKSTRFCFRERLERN